LQKEVNTGPPNAKGKKVEKKWGKRGGGSEPRKGGGVRG